MKRIIVAILCFCICVPLLFINAYAVDTPYKDMTKKERAALPEFLSKYIFFMTETAIDLSEYEGEGGFDFFGIRISSMRLSVNPSEYLNLYGYTIKLDETNEVDDPNEIARLLSENGNFRFLRRGSEYGNGDVNGDEVIDQFDYILAKRIYFETYVGDNMELGYADMDNDGEITVFDYLLIKRTYLGTYSPVAEGE